MTNPSSLIFVAIVLVWAGWLLQHQIRRRQVLLTARTVETFSDAMRVLERREPVYAEVSHTSGRTSLRAGTVIHGERRERAEPREPIEHSEQEAPVYEPNEVDMSVDSPITRTVHRVLEDVRGVLAARRTRGIAFLVAACLLPLTLILVVAAALSPLAVIASLMLLAAVVLWLRAETVAAHRRVGQAPPARPQLRRDPQGGARSTQVARSQRTAQPTGAVTGQAGPVQFSVPAAHHDEQPQVRDRSDVPFDLQPAVSRAEVQQPPVGEEPSTDASVEQVPADGTWSPVQVPKPTYTMKAKAPERSASEPASYANMPTEELPFDGLALDPEVEDLPSAFRAG